MVSSVLDVAESLLPRFSRQPELLWDVSAFKHGFLTLCGDSVYDFLQRCAGFITDIGGELSLKISFDYLFIVGYEANELQILQGSL